MPTPSQQQTNTPAPIEVTADQLPIHCPIDDAALFSSHPRVYIPLHDSPEATCAYCGTVYRLIDAPPVDGSSA